MTEQGSFQRFAEVAAILSFVFALASNALQGVPVTFRLELFRKRVLVRTE